MPTHTDLYFHWLHTICNFIGPSLLNTHTHTVISLVTNIDFSYKVGLTLCSFQFYTQLTKAFVAKASCNSLLIDSATFCSQSVRRGLLHWRSHEKSWVLWFQHVKDGFVLPMFRSEYSDIFALKKVRVCDWNVSRTNLSFTHWNQRTQPCSQSICLLRKEVSWKLWEGDSNICMPTMLSAFFAMYSPWWRCSQVRYTWKLV